MFRCVVVLFLAAAIGLAALPAYAEPADLDLWKSEFSKTDFTRATVPLDEIRDDGNFRPRALIAAKTH